MVLQRMKMCIRDRFPFVRRVNNGQRNQYLIKDSHPPIVTHEEAEAVRNLMAYRVDVLHMNKSDYTKRYLFSGRIICGECGRTFRRQKIYIGVSIRAILVGPFPARQSW